MEKTTMPFARELKLELTNACGLACAHCSTDSGSTASLCIPTADAIRIVCQFRELGGERLILTGGEPLQHPEIDLIAAFSKQIGLQVVVYTTGLDINSDVSRDRLLHLAPIIDGFVFCLHAAVPDVHDHLTGVRGSFEATVSAISLVMRWGKPVCIHHVPLQPNRGEFLSLCTFVMRMGLRSLKILKIRPPRTRRKKRGETRPALVGRRQVSRRNRYGPCSFSSLEHRPRCPLFDVRPLPPDTLRCGLENVVHRCKFGMLSL